jgi:hypothetical protein
MFTFDLTAVAAATAAVLGGSLCVLFNPIFPLIPTSSCDEIFTCNPKRPLGARKTLLIEANSHAVKRLKPRQGIIWFFFFNFKYNKNL